MSYYGYPRFVHPHRRQYEASAAAPASTPFDFFAAPPPPARDFRDRYHDYEGYYAHPFARHFQQYAPEHHVPAPTQAPAPAPAADLDAEERAALEHLRSIQQRREAAAAEARAHAERESAIRRAVEAEKAREEALRLALAREKRETEAAAAAASALAARAAIFGQYKAEAQRRAAAIHQAKVTHFESLRQAKVEQFEAHRQAKQAQFDALRQAKQAQFAEMMRRKAACASHCAAKQVRRAAQDKVAENKDDFEAINGLLGALFGITPVPEDEEKAEEGKKDVEEKKEVKEAPAPAAAAATAPTASAAPAEPAPAYAKTEADAQPATEAKPTDAAPAFPEDVNDLLSQFLGLRVEPTTGADTAKAASSGNAVPRGLNEFLSRFGLVFEPLDAESEAKAESTAAPAAGPSDTKVAEQSKPSEPTAAALNKTEGSETKPAAAQRQTPACGSRFSRYAAAAAAAAAAPAPGPSTDDTPLTAFLNGVTDLPPFVRDILGNIELGWKEESQRRQAPAPAGAEPTTRDKGKGVAEGEKKVRSAPAPAPAPAVAAEAVTAPAEPTVASTSADSDTSTASTTSIAKLHNIASELALARDSFTFPPRLAFAKTAGAAAPAPALLFNKTNSGYHAQANKLLQLLLAADGIASGGDREVRRVRKEVVGDVEREIEGLEHRRDAVWAEVRAKREREGEESEHEEDASSASSVVDHEEAKEREHETAEHVEHVESVENVEAAEQAQSTEPTEATDAAPIQTTDDDAPAYAATADITHAAATETTESHEVTGFEVPPTDAAEAEPQVEAAAPTDAAKEDKPAESKPAKTEEKHEDDFELL